MQLLLEPETVLKADRFAARVAEICRDIPEPEPLAGLKYRRILIPGLIGGEIQFALLGFLGHALQMRGAGVTALMCDELLPACTLQKADHYELACRRWCYKNAGPFVRAAQLEHRWYSDFVSAAQIERCTKLAAMVPPAELTTFVYRDIPLGIHVERSIQSYFKVAEPDLDHPQMLARTREYLTSAMLMTHVGERALDELDIDKVVMDDGQKVDWGVIRDVARRRGIPIDVTQGAPRGACFLVEHDAYPAPSDPIGRWPHWKQIPLTADQDAALDEYFNRRAVKPYEDQSWSAPQTDGSKAAIRRKVGLPPNVPGLVFAMFPNLSYDAAVTTTEPTYRTAAEWVADTIRFFASHTQHHLLVRIHPAEAYRAVLDPMEDFVAENFDRLPPNVHVIAPATAVTAHDILSVIDVALVYTSTVGVEAAYFGIPVVNVGGGWHAGRGISTDVHTPRQYFDALTQLFERGIPPIVSLETARRYAYAVFFRSALPIHHYRAMDTGLTELCIESLEDLRPGNDPTIDIICRGVLLDEPFETKQLQ